MPHIHSAITHCQYTSMAKLLRSSSSKLPPPFLHLKVRAPGPFRRAYELICACPGAVWIRTTSSVRTPGQVCPPIRPIAHHGTDCVRAARRTRDGGTERGDRALPRQQLQGGQRRPSRPPRASRRRGLVRSCLCELASQQGRSSESSTRTLPCTRLTGSTSSRNCISRSTSTRRIVTMAPV